MPSSLSAQTPLETLAVPGRHGAPGDAGVVLTERTGLAIATVIARNGATGALAERMRAAFALDLPGAGRRSIVGPFALVWSGPRQWLAVAADEEGHLLERRVRQALAGLASVSNQTDARAVVRISGVRARDVLAKSVPIDLHPSVFRPNDCASTVAGHIGVQLWQVDDQPTYECVVSRSSAASFWRAIVRSGEEFGVAVMSDLKD